MTERSRPDQKVGVICLWRSDCIQEFRRLPSSRSVPNHSECIAEHRTRIRWVRTQATFKITSLGLGSFRSRIPTLPLRGVNSQSLTLAMIPEFPSVSMIRHFPTPEPLTWQTRRGMRGAGRIMSTELFSIRCPPSGSDVLLRRGLADAPPNLVSQKSASSRVETTFLHWELCR